MPVDDFLLLCLNVLPPALSLVGLGILWLFRQEDPNTARGLGTGLVLSFIGSLVPAVPALLLGASAGSNGLEMGAMLTLILAFIGFVIWLVFLLVGYVISRPSAASSSASEGGEDEAPSPAGGDPS
ncbi:hypothetical protein [Archangium sp.]|jgi:hypothetical protein|uniref:hypothetical protein n=1 Tax=Archangium sp. TaxID=1872627 RepID=UPI002ED9D824